MLIKLGGEGRVHAPPSRTEFQTVGLGPSVAHRYTFSASHNVLEEFEFMTKKNGTFHIKIHMPKFS